MLYDLGFSETGKFRKYWDRWVPPEDELEFCALALTPGMPTAYVMHVAGMRRWQLDYAYDLVDSWREVAEPLGIENAGSITVEDGYNMWMPMVRRGYKVSTAPHWVSISIQTMLSTKQKSVKDMMRELRLRERQIFRLRHSSYHPLTLQRLSPQKGRKRHFQPY